MGTTNITHPSTSIKTKIMIKNGGKKLRKSVVFGKKKSGKIAKNAIKKKVSVWKPRKNEK